MEFAGAQVSAATGAMESALGKLAALLPDENEESGDLESLKAELEAVHALLKSTSEADDPDERARRWMKEVREFSYDVDDGLDDLMLPAGDGSGSRPDGLAGKFKIWLRETTARRRTGEEISASNSMSKASIEVEDPRDCYLYRETPELVVGVDGPSAELVKMLGKGGGEDASMQLQQLKCPSHLKTVSDMILQKCGGLPLAIIAVSELLAANTHEHQWEQAHNSIRHGLGTNPAVERIMRVLLLGYSDLTPCLKSCLLYLSIFPEGYAIKKEHLVLRWIAEGFICEEHGYNLYESGERCFNELINRNLIQPGEINEFGDVETCRVHGIILDFIVSISKEVDFGTLLGIPGLNPEPENKVRRLSLQEGSDIPKDLILCNARSLTVVGNHVKMPSLLDFRHLRILDFEGSSELEDHHLADIGNLFHLKYLRLKYSRITKLPEQIAELRYLESLDICGNITTIEIPSAINQLKRLTRLVVSDDTILPDEIGGVKALQVLEGINVNMQSTNFVRQLGQLSNLKKLSISFINYYAGDNWKENQEEMVSTICRLGKANLHILHIKINEGADEIFEESWCPAPHSLRELVIEVGIVSRVPRWIGSLVNLQKLVILMWDVGQEDVLILGGLPVLRHLCLTALTVGSKDERLKISRSHGFPSLSHFKIGGEECALGLNFEAGSIPKLQKLELEFDAEETLSLTNGNFNFSIEHLSCLTSTSVRCTYEESIPPTLEAAMERAINAHPKHPTLVWIK
ncbi:hypothetical protein ACQ4PT_047536 [Festuca glaucescens]